MALELFRPFIISSILEQELAFNIRGANRLIDDQIPEVWEILENVIRDRYVFLNRAPTLHRLGIQAFRPILIEGNAIQIHPLVCSAFNADFDGDQMAVHVPLSTAAQREAREIIAADKNILKPGNGNPIISLKLDIVLGCYWITKLISKTTANDQIFSNFQMAIAAQSYDIVDLRTPIKIEALGEPKLRSAPEKFVTTSVGRILFNEILPADFPFINHEINSKEMNRLVDDLIATYPIEKMGEILDGIKNLGFYYATRSGITWGIDDMTVPEGKLSIIESARAESARLEQMYDEGLLSRDEKYRMNIEKWTRARSQIEKLLPTSLDPLGSVMYMLNSGARGSISQITQMSGMKGLIVNPSGQTLDFPIIPSYKEGLSPLEFFMTTHGSRKGLVDTALNTAKAGYLTQRLVNVAQEVIVTEKDCGDKHGKRLTPQNVSNLETGIGSLLRGRVLAQDLVTTDGKVLFKKGYLVTATEARQIDPSKLTEVNVRTVLTCQSAKGICQLCYGNDPGRGRLVEIGEAVGIVAAQAIGEPGTQLTMRTKHAGGVDVGGDIVGGLPRVEEVFERRVPKRGAVVSEIAGLVTEIRTLEKEQVIVILAGPTSGKKSGSAKNETVEYKVPLARTVLVKVGDAVTAGQIITDGSANLATLFKYAGRANTEEYIITEISNIYELQGASISRKHIEVIIRQMFSRHRIKSAGGTDFEPGDVVEYELITAENAKAKEAGREFALTEPLLLGISDVSLTSSSFLAAVSFQQSTKMLIKTALRGGLDRLRGLKENVIVGRLIPAGTGLKADYNVIDG